MVFSALSSKQQLNRNRGKVFPVRSVPLCLKQDNWSNESVVRQLPACKKVSKEVENITEIRHQATTDEGTAD
jgi:hypothetical protein